MAKQKSIKRRDTHVEALPRVQKVSQTEQRIDWKENLINRVKKEQFKNR